jgi:hypothetical protein
MNTTFEINKHMHTYEGKHNPIYKYSPIIKAPKIKINAEQEKMEHNAPHL